MKVDNRKPEISLRDYLSSTRDATIIEPTMIDLSEQLKRIHTSYPEYCIANMTASNIGYDEEQGRFCFFNFRPMTDKETETKEDKERFTKIFLGILLSVETGIISDYTLLSTKYIKENADQILQALESKNIQSSYFRQTFVNEDFSEYYHEHIKRMELGEGSNKNAQTYSKSLPGIAGQLLPNNTGNEKQAAFINAIFYPTLMLVLTIVVTVLYKCFEFINK